MARFDRALIGVLLGLFASVNTAFAADEMPLKIKAAPIPEVPFFLVNDNRLSYSYQFQGTDAGYFQPTPTGFDGKTTYQTVALTHFDVWQYGTNFANVSFSKANHNDPASPCTNTGVARSNITGAVVSTDCGGAVSAFGSVRSTFGFNELFNTKAFTYGPLHNVSFIVGGDVGLQNAYFASNTRRLVAGLQFAVDLPYKGYINFSPMFDTEGDRNAFTECGSGFPVQGTCNSDGQVHFQPTWMLETQYYMDLGFLPESIRYFAVSGRVALIGPKGPEKGLPVPNAVQLATEVIAEPIRLTFDAGRAFGGKRWTHEFDLWAAWRYGNNQYGNNADVSTVCNTVRFAGSPAISNGSCQYSSLVLGVTARF
jgi:hypothetical protein